MPATEQSRKPKRPGPRRTATSTLRLSDYARRFAYPRNRIVKTVWPRVEEKGAELGLGFDWWQQQLGMVCLGYGADGKYVATVGGIGMSIPRQVGKTYFVLALLVIMCILFPGLQVVWTAHHLRTSTKTFTTLRGICRRKKVAPHIALNERGKPAIRSANGEQEVVFANGSKIMFGARSMGFGRGFDEVDIEVFDEAQILDTKALEDMVAATNQARHEHGALLFYMGTPPRPGDPSEDYEQRRAEAHAGELDDAIWLEIGADPKSGIDDRGQWPLMNPSFPKRTPLESMLRLRKNLKNDDSWNREGRGIWDDEGSDAALPHGRWLELADADAPRGANVVFGVDVTGDRMAWIAVAWLRSDGDVQLMLANDGEPVPAHRLVDECVRLEGEWGGEFVPPRAFEEDLELAGVTVQKMPWSVFAGACGDIEDRIKAGAVRHGNQAALNDAVKAAKWRTSINGEHALMLRDCPEVGPLVAAVRALQRVVVASEPATPMQAGSSQLSTAPSETGQLSTLSF